MDEQQRTMKDQVVSAEPQMRDICALLSPPVMSWMHVMHGERQGLVQPGKEQLQEFRV